MTVRVSLEAFSDAALRLTGEKVAVVLPRGSGSEALAIHPAGGRAVRASSPEPPEKLAAKLRKEGFETVIGERDGEDGAPAHVVAIAYLSGSGKPGVWIDAFDSPPSEAEALKAFYDDLVASGEPISMSFEAFARDGHFSVAVTSAEELAAYRAAKRCEEL